MQSGTERGHGLACNSVKVGSRTIRMESPPVRDYWRVTLPVMVTSVGPSLYSLESLKLANPSDFLTMIGLGRSEIR